MLLLFLIFLSSCCSPTLYVERLSLDKLPPAHLFAQTAPFQEECPNQEALLISWKDQKAAFLTLSLHTGSDQQWSLDYQLETPVGCLYYFIDPSEPDLLAYKVQLFDCYQQPLATLCHPVWTQLLTNSPLKKP